jgi:hypothetical protein
VKTCCHGQGQANASSPGLQVCELSDLSSLQRDVVQWQLEQFDAKLISVWIWEGAA